MAGWLVEELDDVFAEVSLENLDAAGFQKGVEPDEPPSHTVGPSIHKSLDDTRAIFHERLGTPRDASPERLAAAARELLRDANGRGRVSSRPTNPGAKTAPIGPE